MVASYLTRHGAMRFVGEYEAGSDTGYGRGQAVIVHSEHAGLEVGEVLCETSPRAMQILADATAMNGNPREHEASSFAS